ncbi:hypothetical protein [Deinococcus hopiensis]|uniref:Uncharacterized protein n=1 Tax=Deinococcus hopiensis KR-140 TaxID=695939 RepID=A0A1W1UC04_9DEIO|nr:hypothetical protein [Deinococcus hopiensis]SMB78562.1 hypothetical protein SAMN00790413_06708 [Deinococcus hopiensis KR-140]
MVCPLLHLHLRVGRRQAEFMAVEFSDSHVTSVSMRVGGKKGQWVSLEIESARADGAFLNGLAEAWTMDDDYRALFGHSGSRSYVGRAFPEFPAARAARAAAEAEALEREEKRARRAEALGRVLSAGEAASDEDLWAARSGTDEFSRLSLAALTAELGDIAEQTLKAAQRFELDGRYQAVALRWAARGMVPDVAARKALIDREIAFLARRGR